MSYKIQIQSRLYSGSNVEYIIKNIGTERITMNTGYNTLHLEFGQQESTSNKYGWSLLDDKSKVMLYGYSPYIFTMYGTDKTYVINGSTNNNEPFEVELTTEPIESESCRLTSNRLSPPKFRVRKFFSRVKNRISNLCGNRMEVAYGVV